MNDKWARIIGIPVVSLVFAFIYDGDILRQFDDRFFLMLFPSFLFTITLWEGNRLILLLVRKKYPSHLEIVNRLTMQIVCSVVFTLAATKLLVYPIRFVLGPELCKDKNLYIHFMVNMGATFFVISLYESAYFFGEWKKNVQKTEALARENIQSQFEVLKNQVDPHFLFNSLNTLAALIDENNEPAQKYLEQLSDVYRYVLLNKDRSTVTLEEELAFVESYLYLNKTRFRENLQVETRISEKQQKRKIAPLSLQMLVENAIKHNVISRDKPLTIRISQENDWITVENNVQEKSVFEKSTKVGLQNIINRYSYLSAQPVEITNEPGLFTVRLPLLPA